jgi:cytosine/adenosine deaminase-related metal-dependent hydrolase
MGDLNNIAVRAKRVYLDHSTIVENPLIEIQNGLVVRIERGGKQQRAIDLGPVTIIPGLVNAHSHLEFSLLESPLGNAGIEFTQWVREVISYRANCPTDVKSRAIRRGIGELVASGTIAVGEIATEPIIVSDYHMLDNSVVYLERIGVNPAQTEPLLHSADCWCREMQSHSIHPALSPHAPYSVHPAFLKKLVRLAARYRVPLAIHLAESRSEIELLRDGSGPFVELFQQMGILDNAKHFGSFSLIDTLRLLARAPRVTIVHGNYLGAAEIEFLTRQAEKFSIVYSPRTHHYFRHHSYPLRIFLDAGLNVAVGTDSRASNPDLNLFRELQFIRTTFPELEETRILQMGTHAGAISLGIDPDSATIKIGQKANFNVVSKTAEGSLFSESSACTPWSQFLESADLFGCV